MEFKLRSWDLNDLESLVKHANNYNIAKNLTNQFPHPYTKKNGEAFIAMATKNNPLNIFAIAINKEAVGGIGLHPQQDIHCKNAELGYWLAQPYWGKGIITNAIREIVAYGFKTFEIDRIFARPFGNNIGSQKALEKAGFTLEGKFDKALYKNGEYLDELIYAIRK
jgi:RimJ/RimL family protein N-acetyltransferase